MTFDETEEEPLTSPDTANRTKINPNEGRAPPDDPKKWERLAVINTGAVDSFGHKNQQVARTQERLVAWDILSEALRLSTYQKTWGRTIMGGLKTGGNGGLGETMHLAAYCLAAQVVQHDDRVDRNYHPNRNDENNCDIFLAVADEYEFTEKRVRSCMGRIQNRVHDF